MDSQLASKTAYQQAKYAREPTRRPSPLLLSRAALRRRPRRRVRAPPAAALLTCVRSAWRFLALVDKQPDGSPSAWRMAAKSIFSVHASCMHGRSHHLIPLSIRRRR